MILHSRGRAWMLMHGDFEEVCQSLAGRVHLVACSPPYGDARTYGAAISWTDADYARMGDAVWSALAPGGHALINVDAPVREWRPGFGTERGFHPWRMMLDWAERVGFRVPDRLAFGRRGVPGEYRGRFRNDWEPLLWFQKPGEGYFNRVILADDGATPFSGQVVRHAKRQGVRITRMKGWAAENGKVHRGTLWDYESVGNNHTGATDIEALGHPARWPYRLAADIVQCFCPLGGVVLDPFVGGGTTVAAAIAHGRIGIGGDTDVGWLDKAVPLLLARES